MQSFHDLFFSRTAPNNLLRMLGEGITYVPGSGAERSIVAIVERRPPERLTPGKPGSAYQLVVKVMNDPALGISASELDVGADSLRLSAIEGGALQLRAIVARENDDGGMLKLGVR